MEVLLNCTGGAQVLYIYQFPSGNWWYFWSTSDSKALKDWD